MMVNIASDSACLADHIELLIGARQGENFNLRRIQETANHYWGADDVQVSYAMSVARDRANVLGDRYPFKVGRAYVVKEREALIYESLLCLTRTNWVYSFEGSLDGIDTTKDFEVIAEHCLSGFYGESTLSVNFGWPSTLGRPMEFSPAVSWLADRIGIPVGSAYRQPRRKDGGVDIVVWRAFGDGRPGVPIVLVQATVQTDVLSKARDIDRRLWAGWLATDIDPTVALAIPGTVTNTEVWNEISRNSLLLDRIRLANLAPAPGDSVQEVCSSVVEAVRFTTARLLELE